MAFDPILTIKKYKSDQKVNLRDVKRKLISEEKFPRMVNQQYFGNDELAILFLFQDQKTFPTYEKKNDSFHKTYITSHVTNGFWVLINTNGDCFIINSTKSKSLWENEALEIIQHNLKIKLNIDWIDIENIFKFHLPEQIIKITWNASEQPPQDVYGGYLEATPENRVFNDILENNINAITKVYVKVEFEESIYTMLYDIKNQKITLYNRSTIPLSIQKFLECLKTRKIIG